MGPGDAVYCHTASPHFMNCGFRFNGMTYSEGAALACDSLSFPVCQSCVFSGNVASVGGAAYAMETSGPSFIDCEFSENTAASAGGAIYVWRAALTLVGCTFSGNSATHQGGALCAGYSSPEIHACLFENNTTYSSVVSWGGALCFRNSCSPQITDTRFIGNTAGGPTTLVAGGAVCFAHGCAPAFQRCTFSGNRLPGGGEGGAVSSNMSSTAMFEECRFHDNSALFYGGAVCHGNSAGVLEFVGCEFSGHSAEWGGALDLVDGVAVSSAAPWLTTQARMGAASLSRETPRASS